MRHFTLLCLCLLALAATSLAAQPSFPLPSPHAVVSQQVGVTEVTVEYHRPGVKGRTIWGELVPYGEIWRTGANSRTKVSFSTAVTIAGTELEAGSYGLLTIPGETTWTVILSKDADSSPFRYDQANDAVRVETAARSSSATERMEMRFTDLTDHSATLLLAWDEIEISLFGFEVDTAEIVADAARDAFGWQGPQRAANWALQNGSHAEEAMTWINMSISAQPVFWNLAVKARLLAAADDHEGAIKVAEMALAAADEMSNPPNDTQLDNLRSEIDGWN